MTIRSFFPPRMEVAPLKKKGIAAFNRDLIDVCDSLRLADKTGQRWSARHYPGGYTSYGSHDQMHRISSTFALLEKALDPQVRAYAVALGYDLRGRKLQMTDCRVNMRAGAGTPRPPPHPPQHRRRAG